MKTIWLNYVRLSKIIIHSQVQGRMRWGTPLRNMKSILCHLSSLLLQFLLLERASSWLNTISEQLESHSLCKMETLELTIESNLLKGNLYMQQGHTALWYDDFMHVYCVHVYILPILTIFMSPPLQLWHGSFIFEAAPNITCDCERILGCKWLGKIFI